MSHAGHDRRHKTDATHAEVRDRFRERGCTVYDTSRVGDGFGDLLVELPKFKRMIIVEVKDGKKSPSDRRLTPREVAFSLVWWRHWYVVESPEEAEMLIANLDVRWGRAGVGR